MIMDDSNWKKYVWSRWGLILFLFVSGWSSAGTIPNYNVDLTNTLLNITTLHWADTSKKATPAQVQASLNNAQLTKGHFNPPFSSANHWFVFSLSNTTSKSISQRIFFKRSYHDKIKVHFLEQGRWVSKSKKRLLVGSDRRIDSALPIFDFTLAPHQAKTFYIETHSVMNLVHTNINVRATQKGGKAELLHLNFVKLFIGASFIILLLNALMFFSVRDKLYLYLCGYNFSFCTSIYTANSFDILLGLDFKNRDMLLLSYHSAAVFLLLFIAELIETKKHMPKVHKLLVVCLWLVVGVAMMSLVDSYYLAYTFCMFAPIGLISTCVVIYAGIKGRQHAVLLSLGSLLFITGDVITMLSILGYMPENVSSGYAVGMFIGAIAQMLIFSLVLFRRVVQLNEAINHDNLSLIEEVEAAKSQLEQRVFKRTKQLAVALQAVERSSAARDSFFANINHEMRTPLSGILGMVELMGHQPGKAVSTQNLRTLKTSSYQLSHLINNVLDHSKLTHGVELKLNCRNFSILDQIGALENMFLDMADDKGIFLHFNVTSDMELGRHGDDMKLLQLLINLVSNAIKFTHSGMVKVVVSCGTSGDDVLFSVIDTGTGIQAQEIEHIFTPYYQASGSNSCHQAGSGLGLSIAHSLAQTMGGALNVQSQPGEGTRFDLCLPLKRESRQNKTETGAAVGIKSLDLSEKCILLADDSAINQQVVEAFLVPTGATLLVVNNGEKAVDRFKQGGVDVVLMDLHMDAMGGVEAVRQIRTFESSINVDHCPIIVHTADTAADVLHQVNQAGADHCLYKPYTQVQLLDIVCELLDMEFVGDGTELVDVTNMGGLVDKFLLHCDHSFSRCNRYIEGNDFEKLGEEIHQLSGNCGIFGATSLCDTLKKLEALLTDNKTDAAPLLKLLNTAEDQLQMYRLPVKLK